MRSQHLKLKKVGNVYVSAPKPPERVRIVHVNAGQALTVDGTRDSASISVTCTLEGEDTGGNAVNLSQPATGTGPTTWTADFGTVADGCYLLTATGSDLSSDDTNVEVGSARCPVVASYSLPGIHVHLKILWDFETGAGEGKFEAVVSQPSAHQSD
jgi:hypothetical protein